MNYYDMVQKVQSYSGFTRGESEDALQVMVESLSVHLPEPERKRFASRLPDYLQSLALSVFATESNSREDIVKQFMNLQHIDEKRAKKQIKASWSVLKDAISGGQLQKIKSQLPPSSTNELK